MQTVSRLIELFTPESYDLSVTLEREKRTFHGTVTIKGTVHSDKEIRFHSKGLTIGSVTLDGKLAEFAHQKNDELVIAHPDLNQGNHTVVIAFAGKITDGMHGLYPCYYTLDGIKKELLATQFESHSAREVFPCIDEPAAKATFTVTLTTEENVTVLGNMPLKSQRTDPEGLVTTFDKTPRMSTYLLAWVVGDLQKKSAQTKRGIDVNIWSTPAQPLDSLDFALGIATRAIDFYEEFFDTEYPLPKSDHVALPDFSAGAMENWGLITYREMALLADPKVTSITSRQYIATVVTHELAHQWFGNLVTMEWWNDLWLNESFANMMEYLATDALEPSWNMWLEFSSNEAILALRRDSIDGVQSVQMDVNHPDEIDTLFDGAIVYAKGGRLLRMVQQYVGNDAFRAGLKAYFAQHAYGNTKGNDLWRALSDASGKDITTLMNRWISQPGYPVVHATANKKRVELAQEQFFVGPHITSDRLWPIPLDGPEDADVMTTPRMTVKRTDHFQLNIHDSAHFITDYDQTLRDDLLAHVKDGSLNELNRLQLLNEATLLARGGIVPSAQLINLVSVYENETSEAVWGLLFLALSELRKCVEDDEAAEKALRQFSGRVAKKQYARLGWDPAEDEPEEDSKLRTTIISLTLYSEDQAAINEAKRRYETTPLEQLNPELRSLILSSVVRYGDKKIVDDLLTAHAKTNSPDLQLDICLGVTSTRLPDQIDRLLDLIKDPQTIRPQDAAHWYVYLLRGRDSKQKTWQWVRDNWQWVMDTFKGDKSYDSYPRYAAGALSTKQTLDEYKAFFLPLREDPSLTRVIDMGISEIEGRVELIDRDSPAVRQKLLDLK
jgi:aminopeptidase N